MKKIEDKTIKDIVYASLFKRVIAIIMDIVLFFAIFSFLFWPAIDGSIDLGFHNKQIKKQMEDLQFRSGLFVDLSKNQDKSVVSQIDSNVLSDGNGYFTFDSYKTYVKALNYFYLYSDYSDYFWSKKIENPSELASFDKNKWFNEEILNIGKDEKFDAFYYESGNVSEEAVTFTLDENKNILSYEVHVLVKDTITFNNQKYTRNGDENAKNQDYIISYLKFFTESKVYDGEYLISLQYFKERPTYNSLYKWLSSVARYNAYISMIPACLICFFLFPMIFKNGETLGMKAMHLGYVNVEEYQVGRGQVLVKKLYVCTELYIATLTFLLIYLVDYLVMIFTKKHRSIGDLIAGTIMIDTKNSVWFYNKEVEEKLIERINSNLEDANISSEN